MSEVVVVKVGGGVLLDASAARALVTGIETLVKTKTVVVIHGGGPQSTEMAGRLGHSPTIIQGRRVTSDLDLDIALSTICGVVNSQLVGMLTAAGLRAVGLTGASNRMILASKRPPWTIDGLEIDFGHVGDIDSVDPLPIKTLAEGGLIPVVASVGITKDGSFLNINADTTSVELAVALDADELLLVTTSGGLLREGKILPSCDRSMIDAGINEGWITDGMHVKLETGLKAVKSGVNQVRIVGPDTIGQEAGGTRLAEEGRPEYGSGFAEAGVGLGSYATVSDAMLNQAQHDKGVSDPVEILKTLIRFPSLTGNEREIADWVEAWALALNLGVGRFENSVYCWIGEGDDCLLLNSHLDVVPPSSDHPHSPFEPVEVEGLIYGRGSVDAKASGAAMLSAIGGLAVEDWRPAGRLLVALTECEEGTGKRNGLQRLLPQLPPTAGAIVGEPTSLQPCTSQKGMLILKATARGRTAHAARPQLGENAITKAARDIAVLEDLELERIHPDLGQTSLAVTTIAGGSARNVIPEECTFFIDVRTTPAYSHEEIISLLGGHLESELTVHSGRYVPRATPVGSRIATTVKQVLPDGEPFGSPTVSDWAFLEHTPAIKLGPGDSNLSHTGAECIEAAEVRAAAELYAGIARAFFEHETQSDPAGTDVESSETVHG